MKLQDTQGHLHQRLVRELDGTPAVMRKALTTRGGIHIDAGVAVTLTGTSRFVWVQTPKCAHCGVTFSCKLTTSDLPEYVALVVPPAATEAP